MINSFRPGYVSSLACSLFPLFSLFSGEGKLHFYFCCNSTALSSASFPSITNGPFDKKKLGSWLTGLTQQSFGSVSHWEGI